MWKPTIATLALGLVVGGTASADETINLGRYQPQAAGFAGAVASATSAGQPDGDTVLVHGRRYYGGHHGRYYGGYRGGFAISFSSGYRGYGWPGYGYGGFYGRSNYGWPGYGYGGFYGRSNYGWPGYGYGYGYRGLSGYPYYGSGFSLGYYQPGFALSLYSAPRYYASYYSAPRYYSYGYSSYGFGGYCPIGGTTAATVALALPTRPAVPLTNGSGGSLRYDGGPANPIPLPAADHPESTTPRRIEPAVETDSVPISLKKPVYKYPAYGEK